MKKQLLIILLFPFLIFSQSNSDCDYKKEYDNGDMYEGCTDVEGRFNGKGKYLWADGRYYSGYWVNNKREGSGEFKFSDGSLYIGDWVNNKMDGKGKYTNTDGDIYEGYYKDNMKNGEGIQTYTVGNIKVVKNGIFKNDMFFSGEYVQSSSVDRTTVNAIFEYGDRTSSIQTSPEFTIKTKGSYFSNGTLKSGTKKVLRKNGDVVISEYKNGDEVVNSIRSNIKNYYNENDIKGDLASIIIDLEFEENDNTKYVNLSFLTNKKTQTENFRFIFDTGAEMFSIGYNLFNKLKENGLDYVDLGIVKESVGIRGESLQNKVIRIKELSIGQYKVKNVIAFVKTLETANSSLLGIGFLKKFSEAQWSLISNQLTLYK
jgi:hypothetical protein